MKLLVMTLMMSAASCGGFGLTHGLGASNIYNDDGGYDPNPVDDGGGAGGSGDGGNEPSTLYSYEGHYDLSIGHVDVRVDQTNYLYGSYGVTCTAIGALSATATRQYPDFNAFFAGGCPMVVGSQSLTFFPSQATMPAFVQTEGVLVLPHSNTFPVCQLGTWGTACNGR